MRDIIFYFGTDSRDFSVISATFHQFARAVELHYITEADELFTRLCMPERLPTLIFASLGEDSGPVLELVQHVKSHPAARWIPIILIGHGNDHWKHEEVISAGAAAFLRSPLQPDCLQRLFSAGGDLLIRPQEDAPLLMASPQKGAMTSDRRIAWRL
jgi:CheY-like chemotaxis protein